MYTTERYQRQILLKEFGEAGQNKLRNARVLVIGIGGLGCPALLYLAAAGVGTIGIVDYDIVELANLHRQILYTPNDIGKPKAEVAAIKLRVLNPDISIKTYNLLLKNTDALKIIAEFDVVIDGSDNFSTRYLVNDACLILNKPLVYGAVLRFEGQVGVFNLADKASGIKTNYRDLFPKPTDNFSTLSCNEAGVLGVVPGIIGTMQATEAIKIITGIGDVLHNQFISYNFLSNTFCKFTITPSREITQFFPRTEKEFLNYNYHWFCGVHQDADEISIEDFDSLKSTGKVNIIDVRENNELPLVNEFSFTQIPISEFENKIDAIDRENSIIFFCQTGKRSAIAMSLLKKKFANIKAFSLSGGIVAWKKHHQKNSF